MIKVIDLLSMENICIGENEKTVLCLGNFDGVHVAHAELVRRTICLGDKLSLSFCKGKRIRRGAFFFADHPRNVLKSDTRPTLTSVADKLVLFRDMGLEIAIIADFDALMNMSPDEFVRDVLIEKCALAGAVCGYNFRFGKDGKGDAARLCSLIGKDRCEVVKEIRIDGLEVSSSAIRSALGEGNVELAARLLGYNYCIRARSSQNGGEIILPFDTALQGEGTYKVRVSFGGETFCTDADVLGRDGRMICLVPFEKLPSGEDISVEFIKKSK